MNSVTWNSYGGTLDTNGFTLTINGTFNLGSGGTRALTLGSSVINVDAWTVTSSSGLTLTKGTSTINITGTSTWTNGNAVSYATVNISPTAAASILVNNAGTIDNLTLNCSSAGNLDVTLGNNITINTTLGLNGYSDTRRLFLANASVGSSRTISGSSTVTGQYVDIQDINITAAPNLSAITGGAGDCGGNSNITFTTPATQHWVTSGGGNWGDVANWTSRVPLPQDDVVMDASFGASQTVTVDVPRLGKSIDWSDASFTSSLLWSSSAAMAMYGSLTLVDGMSSSSNTLTLSGRSSFTLNTGSSSQTINITVSASSGTYTLTGDLKLVSSRTLTVSRGTLTCDTYAITTGLFALSNGTINLGSNTHTILANGTPWEVTGGTLNGQTSTITFTDTTSNNIAFTGGSKIYNNVWFNRGSSTANITISGSNTYNEFKDTGTAAHTILWTASTTHTFTGFSVRGSTGALITLDSTSTATYSFVKIPIGLVQSDFLNIQHSVATPANFWFAGTNSVNNQATATAGSGWIFTNHTTFRQPIRPKLFTPGLSR